MPTIEPSIFLSYSRKDIDRVRCIVDAAAKRGWTINWDQEGFQSADHWQKRLFQRLESSHAVVVVWTKTSVRSSWVHREAKVGLAKGRLFPVLLDRDAKIPSRYRKLQAADLTDWKGEVDDSVLSKLWNPLESQLSLDNGMATIRPVLTVRRIRLKPPPQGSTQI